MKNIQAIYGPPKGHWVGDGFPVRTLFSYDRMGASVISPFLLLDYAGPKDFAPAVESRGVGQHPHRGFETVTIVYKGELEHRDSSGGGGLIGAGDVQWMTAGAGIVHEEFHSPSFTRNGGPLEMVQLWVNLPATNKTEPAAYQSIAAADIPDIALPDNAGQLRVIAGAFNDTQGPASTYTSINVWDVALEKNRQVSLRIPESHNTMLMVRHGTVLVNNSETVGAAQLVVFSHSSEEITLQASEGVELLILSGEPIDEPVAGMGPFVMNSPEEIQQAVRDFRHGHFGVVN